MATVFHPELRALMNQAINVAARTGADVNGDPAYAAPAAVDARVEPNRRVIENASGQFITSEFAIYTEQAIGSLDRVWLPGDSPADATKARLPLKVFVGIDEDGSESHYEVLV